MFGKNMVSLLFDYLCAKLLETGGRCFGQRIRLQSIIFLNLGYQKILENI